MLVDKKLRKRILITLTVSIVVTVVMFYRYNFYFFFLRLITPRTKKAENDAIIKDLHPIFAYKVARFVRTLEKEGRDVKLTSGYRSWEKQQQLIDQGYQAAAPGNSYHNYGMAIDMNVDNLVQASSVNNWKPVSNIAKNDFGFRWGGDFQGNWDKVHFDLGNTYKIDQLKNLYNLNQLVNKRYVKIF